MDGFIEIQKRLKSFDINKVLESVWKQPKVQQFIIALITEGNPNSQLYNHGIDGDGLSLGDYSDFTIQHKLNGNGDRRIDHITLKDSGSFFESVEVLPNSKGFKTEANPITDDGSSLYDRFGKNIIKLSDENTKILTEFIAPYFDAEATKILS